MENSLDTTRAGSSPAVFIPSLKSKENQILQFLLCLFGFHGAVEIDHTIDNEEIKVCRDCLKEVE